MSRHIEVKDAPTVVGDDKEAIENTEGERWLSEEVHRCDDFTVVLQERRPSLCWLRISRRSSHPSQHRSLRDIEAEHLELAVNPRRVPGPVLGHHAEDKFTQLFSLFCSHSPYAHTIIFSWKTRLCGSRFWSSRDIALGHSFPVPIVSSGLLCGVSGRDGKDP